MLASKDFGRAPLRTRANPRVFPAIWGLLWKYSVCRSSRPSPRTDAGDQSLSWVAAWFRKLLSIKEKVCAGPVPLGLFSLVSLAAMRCHEAGLLSAEQTA